MSQLFKVSFLEPIRIKDDVYSPGYGFTAPAEQFFGPYATRQLAPLNLFKEDLFEEISRGYYKIARDFILQTDTATLRKGDRFYGQPLDSGSLGIVTFKEDPIGDYVMHVSGVAVTNGPAVIDMFDILDVDLYFTEGGEPISVSGPELTVVDAESGHYKTQVMGFTFGKPGSFQVPIVFTTSDGTTTTYPLSVTVRYPEITFTQNTQSLLASQQGLLDFNISVFDVFPNATLVSSTMDRGGTVGKLISKGSGNFSLEVKPGDLEGNSRITVVFDLGGYTATNVFTLSVLTKDVNTGMVGTGVLDINLTQLLKIMVTIGGVPVTNLTTKSLVASGSKSINTYTKKLAKVDDKGMWQWSVYTNSTEGPIYFDIVVTVDGVDYQLPRQTYIVRSGGA